MTDLFAPAPTDNILPYDGNVNDLGIVINDANTLYDTLLNELPWQSDIVTLFGKTHVTTRQIVWMGDADADYQYSGHTRQTVPWSDIVFHVKQYVEKALADIGIAAHFNTCLLNYYPTGTDGMGYHADDEKELGHQPIIASLSLGATRNILPCMAAAVLALACIGHRAAHRTTCHAAIRMRSRLALDIKA